MDRKYHIETISVQGGWDPKNGESRVAPIIQSTTYKYETAQELADLFDLKAAGHFYTRLSNPTVECLEKKMAALCGGIGAIATSSGQGATSLVALNLCSAGDHIVSASTIYGGSTNLLGHSLAAGNRKPRSLKPERGRRRNSGGNTPEYKIHLRRNALEPQRKSPRLRQIRENRQSRTNTVCGRQHLPDPRALPPV